MSDSPLAGSTIVVTRPASQAAELVAALEARGAAVVRMPTIAIVDPPDGGTALRQAAGRVSQFDWVVFTSENGVARMFAVADADELRRARLAAIGQGTAQALARLGFTARLVPERFVGEALVEAFAAEAGGGRVLIARAAKARDVVPEGLRRLGFDVEVVAAYQTVPAPADEATRQAARRASMITFTSSSTVDGYLAYNDRGDLPPLVATIGPVTSATARARGVEVDIEAVVHSSGGLVEAICRWSERESRQATPVEPDPPRL